MLSIAQSIEAGIKWMTAFLICCVVFSGCEAKKPIRIGFVAGISGRVADLGISGRDAAQLAVDQCNQSGGIAGRKVILITKDDQQRPELVKQAVRELIDEGVVAIIGPMTSDMAMTAIPIANAAKVLLLSPTATTEALSGKDDYFIRVTSTTGDYASLSADFNFTVEKMKTVAAAYDLNNRSFSELWLKNYSDAFSKLGGEVVTQVGFKADGPLTFLEIASELLALKPDGVLLIANSMDSAMLCQQIRKMNPKARIMMSDWGATERLLVLGGRAVEGATVVQTFDRNNQSEKYITFRKAYMEHFGREPGFPGVNTYDITEMLLSALRKQKNNQDLKAAILSMTPFKGLQGDIELTPNGDIIGTKASISVVKNGRFEVVE